jgi:hypothetical protein
VVSAAYPDKRGRAAGGGTVIVDARTTTYEQPAAPLTEREHDLHVHYASNAIACGHADDCGRPECTCAKAVA